MNPLVEQASEYIGMAGLATVLTLLFVIAFLAWVWYAYTPRNREKFEDAALLPFEEGVDR
jgi:cbb3-type cytochrome oxidase subunit 3